MEYQSEQGREKVEILKRVAGRRGKVWNRGGAKREGEDDILFLFFVVWFFCFCGCDLGEPCRLSFRVESELATCKLALLLLKYLFHAGKPWPTGILVDFFSLSQAV